MQEELPPGFWGDEEAPPPGDPSPADAPPSVAPPAAGGGPRSAPAGPPPAFDAAAFDPAAFDAAHDGDMMEVVQQLFPGRVLRVEGDDEDPDEGADGDAEPGFDDLLPPPDEASENA